MAGYSATPQARKLGLQDGQRVGLIAAGDWQPVDAPALQYAVAGAVDVLIAFVRSAAALDGVAEWGRRIFPDGALWIAWPRRAAGHLSDVTDTAVRSAVLPVGLVDVKVAAIDEDWSGLKVVWRRENRGREKN